MKTFLMCAALFVMVSGSLRAEPLRIALLDFEDTTGLKADHQLGGAIDTHVLAAKGIDLLSKQLLDKPDFVLIDRRDFVAKLVTPTLKEAVAGTPRPAFIQAAQLLGADAVLGGSLASFSTRKEKYDQGGYATTLTKLSMRVTLRAMDVVDGSVVAIVDGAAEESFRQTDSMQTEISEEDVLQMMEKALAKAVPELAQALSAHQAAPQRPRVRIGIDTTDNPALVEIDGILVGSTPIIDLEVYPGDHTLTISRPGYEAMAKRLVLDRDFQISVPMLRTELTADERRAILEKADMKAYLINGRPDLLIQEIGP